MKIIHSAPLDIEISPNLKYAGTERVLLWLNQGLDQAGQTSVVAAPGNSNLGGYGKLLATRPEHLWIEKDGKRTMVRSQEEYEKHYKKVMEYATNNEFDLIHDHPGQFMMYSEAYQGQKNSLNIPLITTTHQPTITQGMESEKKILEQQKKFNLIRLLQTENIPLHFITLSQSHRREYESIGIKVDATIYNGIDTSVLPFVSKKQDYLLWLGRLCDYKGTDLAVQVAKKTGRPLIIAGELHTPFVRDYEKKIKPHLTHTITGEQAERERESLLERIASGEEVVKEGEIMFFGPVNDKQKAILYGHASTTLQPNRWKEPFGLVPVESMATGTPVIVTNTGALPELVENLKTGIIVDAFNKGQIDDEQIIEGTIAALNQIGTINPRYCRDHVKKKFSKERMTQNYLDFYRSVA